MHQLYTLAHPPVFEAHRPHMCSRRDWDWWRQVEREFWAGFSPKGHRGYELETWTWYVAKEVASYVRGRSSMRAILFSSAQEVGLTWRLHCGYHLRRGGVEDLNDACHSALKIVVKTSTTSACAAIWLAVSRQPCYRIWLFNGQHTRQIIRCVFKASLKLYTMCSERGRDLKRLWLCSSIRYGHTGQAVVQGCNCPWAHLGHWIVQ